jgi:enoyl-CoA hydratase
MSGPPKPDAEVIVRVEGKVGRLTLNRPQALHALTTDMCRLLTQALLAWRDDPAVELVL